jgi:hypothetical protein
MDMIREAANQGDAPSARLRLLKRGVNLSRRRLAKIESGAIVLKSQAESIVEKFERDDEGQMQTPAVTHGVDEDLLGAKLRAKTLPLSHAECLGLGRDPADGVRNIAVGDAKADAPRRLGANRGVAASSESGPMSSAIDKEMIAASER